MNKLESIRNCHVCGGNDLVPMDNVPVPDIFTDEEIRRFVLFCNDCETIHYIDNGIISYEFSCKVNESITKKRNKKYA